ncbi:MAG: transporter substrate-binding domain-containing protein [Lachnospiraceae bacterium]|nr:transporter substrate-binding domain-containing protein [Lachnospiraceae bacterium]
MKNKAFKKVLTGVLATVLSAGLLAGCTSQAAPSVEDFENNSGSGSVTSEEVQPAGEVRKIYAVTGASPRPFTYYDDNNELTGQNIELVTAIFDKLPQYELVWEVTDFPSIFAGLDSDKYQLGVNNFAKNPEREEKYIFTDPIFSNAYIVVFRKDLELPEKLDFKDLAGLNYVGQTAINVTTAIEKYNDENPDNQIKINYTEEDLNVQLNDLEAGKYDFLVIDKPMYWGFYQPEFGYDLNTADLAGYGVGEGLDSYLIVSKTEENEQLVADINAALREVIEEGKSKELNEKYFGDDYSPSYK